MSAPLAKHILVPHDFSETAERALQLALDFAGPLSARITVLHAYELATYVYPEGPLLTAEMATQIERAAGDALEAVGQRARRSGVEVKTLLRVGAPWKEIISAADEGKVDLVVMGTHGRRGLSRWLLGSVAERVVRTAHCPVMVVPARTA